jgi:hypothetical protein
MIAAVRFYDLYTRKVLFGGRVFLYEEMPETGSLASIGGGEAVRIRRRRQQRGEVECRAYVTPDPYVAYRVTADEGAAMVALLSHLRAAAPDPMEDQQVWQSADSFTKDRIVRFARMYSADQKTTGALPPGGGEL